MTQRIFIVFLSLLCLSPVLVAKEQAPALSAVIIQGNKNVKEKTIRGQIKSRPGRPYSTETATADIQSILELGYFDNVEVALDTATWRLTFLVKEKPYIKKIVFKGTKKISEGRLRDDIPLKEKDFYDAGKFEESKEKILTLYHDRGYADARLEVYPTVDEATSQMTITFLVTEGNRILIGDVAVEGVRSFKPKKILKLMKTKKKKVYKEETLREDVRQIETFYKNNGYMEATVGEPRIAYNDERTSMYITLPIKEGPRFKLGSITLSGNDLYSDQELRKAVPLRSGQLYSEERLLESRQAIAELYSDKGYLHARVEPQFDRDPDKGIMNIDFAITEGDRIRVGNIYIDGLNYTREYVIRRELVLNPGDVFAATKVRRSIERIYNLGFIDAVEPEIQPTESPGTMDLVLGITEGKPGILSAGAGYSSIDQLVGTLQVQHINLFGRAQRLNLLWEFGARKQNYEIDWTEPWFMNRPMSLGLGIFNTERRRDFGTIFSAYKEGRRGGSVRIGPRLDDYLSLLFSYSYEDIDVFDIDPLVAAQVSPSRAVTSSLSSQVVWDSRDNIFDASRGNRQSLSVQFAGGPLGGDVNFIKPIARSSWFFPTFWKFVLSLNGTVGVIENFAPSTDVPIYERFYVGGAETIRGYQYRSEIGPDEGGKVMSVFNVEYKFPIVQERKRTVLQGALFCDFGGAWRSPNDIVLRFGEGENELKAGVGFGIRFTTPVFPLRLDWGYGLNHRPGEELSQFYFTIGNVF